MYKPNISYYINNNYKLAIIVKSSHLIAKCVIRISDNDDSYKPNDFNDQITFTEYTENGKLCNMSVHQNVSDYDSLLIQEKHSSFVMKGIIPNIQYKIGNEQEFVKNHKNYKCNGEWVIPLDIPFNWW